MKHHLVGLVWHARPAEGSGDWVDGLRELPDAVG